MIQCIELMTTILYGSNFIVALGHAPLKKFGPIKLRLCARSCARSRDARIHYESNVDGSYLTFLQRFNFISQTCDRKIT